MRAQEIAPKTARYKKAQLEFFIGAEAALFALNGSSPSPMSITDVLMFMIALGRDMAVEYPDHVKYLSPTQKGN